MDKRHGWVWLVAGLGACIAEKAETAEADTSVDSGDSAGDTAAGCNDFMTKDEWIEAWRQAFCTWAIQCERPVYGESMERCYENTTGPIDRCLDECRTADALAAMQAHLASGSCESAPTEAGVPYCDE